MVIILLVEIILNTVTNNRCSHSNNNILFIPHDLIFPIFHLFSLRVIDFTARGMLLMWAYLLNSTTQRTSSTYSRGHQRHLPFHYTFFQGYVYMGSWVFILLISQAVKYQPVFNLKLYNYINVTLYQN